ncbi:hypothetical protein PR048_020714 [Dryococelus australis]|uniref:Uncharacterized protein n=1 Tax=Dryococelus australis TaxID=614101 RepID=A0ABQ9H739_9NEOP|nr:hypothetical protein PR048_020714 [Dryococelus australis]
MQGREERELHEKTRRAASSSVTIPTCGNCPAGIRNSVRLGGEPCSQLGYWLVTKLSEDQAECDSHPPDVVSRHFRRIRSNISLLKTARGVARTRNKLTCRDKPASAANRLLFLAESLQDFRKGSCAGRCRWPAGFLRDIMFPPQLHSGSAPCSPRFTLINSRDLDVKSRSNPRPHLAHSHNIPMRLTSTANRVDVAGKWCGVCWYVVWIGTWCDVGRYVVWIGSGVMCLGTCVVWIGAWCDEVHGVMWVCTWCGVDSMWLVCIGTWCGVDRYVVWCVVRDVVCIGTGVMWVGTWCDVGRYLVWCDRYVVCGVGACVDVEVLVWIDVCGVYRYVVWCVRYVCGVRKCVHGVMWCRYVCGVYRYGVWWDRSGVMCRYVVWCLGMVWVLGMWCGVYRYVVNLCSTCVVCSSGVCVIVRVCGIGIWLYGDGMGVSRGYMESWVYVCLRYEHGWVRVWCVGTWCGGVVGGTGVCGMYVVWLWRYGVCGRYGVGCGVVIGCGGCGRYGVMLYLVYMDENGDAEETTHCSLAATHYLSTSMALPIGISQGLTQHHLPTLARFLGAGTMVDAHPKLLVLWEVHSHAAVKEDCTRWILAGYRPPLLRSMVKVKITNIQYGCHYGCQRTGMTELKHLGSPMPNPPITQIIHNYSTVISTETGYAILQGNLISAALRTFLAVVSPCKQENLSRSQSNALCSGVKLYCEVAKTLNSRKAAYALMVLAIPISQLSYHYFPALNACGVCGNCNAYSSVCGSCSANCNANCSVCGASMRGACSANCSVHGATLCSVYTVLTAVHAVLVCEVPVVHVVLTAMLTAVSVVHAVLLCAVHVVLTTVCAVPVYQDRLKRDSSEHTTFCYSADQRRCSRVHCMLRRLWFLDNGSRRNGMPATSSACSGRHRAIDVDSSTPIAALQCRYNEAVRPVTNMRQDGSHSMLWSHCVLQYPLVSAYDPLLSTGSTHASLS